MVMDMVEKPRYKGDSLGQASVNGVLTGMVVNTVNEQDVRAWDFEDIMDLLADVGVMDPDSKSAASWGAAGQGIQRKPVEPASLPINIEFVIARSKASAGLAPFCVNGQTKRDGVLGLALSAPLLAALDLFSCKGFGPELRVTKAEKLPQGGFAVQTVEVGGKDMPAATALKMSAKAGGLKNMAGICVGIPRPQLGGEEAGCEAAQWALFPLVGATKEGGIALRCKGLGSEGLLPPGASGGKGTTIAKDLEMPAVVRLFCPASEGVPSARSMLAPKLGGNTTELESEGSAMCFATNSAAFGVKKKGLVGIVGAAVLGTAGSANTTSPTCVHRQAALLVAPSAKAE